MIFHHVLALSSFVHCRFIRAILVAIDLSHAHGWIVAVLQEGTKREAGSSPRVLCFSECVFEKLSFRASTSKWGCIGYAYSPLIERRERSRIQLFLIEGGKSMSDEKDENLKAVYQQLCDSYRAIDDFRTKLLGF